MSTTLDTSGLDRLMAGLRKLGDFDATPLMISWEQIIDEDNRQGVLRGLDKDGLPMVPVKYRPRPPGPRKLTKAQRGGARANAKKGPFLFNSLGGVNHGNLTSGEYRLLGGPPLAPRDQFSRVITNLKTGHAREGASWVAFGAWDEVVSTKGVPFLRFHFDGAGNLPRRDLRGVRPAGIAKALSSLRAFAEDLLRQAFGGTP
jgi:hypothetical protein